MKSTKRSQIKFGETFGVIIVVYIVVMVGMIWYNDINTKDISNMQEEDARDRAFEKYYYVVNSDMLHISQQGDVDLEFSLNSVRTFKNYSKTTGREYIRKRLGEGIIEVRMFDKDFNSIENLTIYNNSLSKDKNKDTEVFRTLIPVIDEINKTTNIGLLLVTTYK